MKLKQLKDLPTDVYSLFDPEVHHEVNEENLDTFCKNIREMFKHRLAKQEEARTPLRFSALGKPNRQMWYEGHPEEGTKEPMLPKTYLKFMYGALIEEMLLFLIKEAGHEVKDEQREVEVGGVKGHIDAIIDGVVVDVKSASPYGYKKFETNTVTQDDPFGYVEQLSGYAHVLTPGKGAAWVAMEKVTGDICVSELGPIVIDHHQPEPRIDELKEVLEQDTPPEPCYEPVPDGKSGNMKLPTGCSYCAHKFRCCEDRGIKLRAFAYSTGPRYLTEVKREPLATVPEINIEQS